MYHREEVWKKREQLGRASSAAAFEAAALAEAGCVLWPVGAVVRDPGVKANTEW